MYHWLKFQPPTTPTFRVMTNPRKSFNTPIDPLRGGILKNPFLAGAYDKKGTHCKNLVEIGRGVWAVACP